MAPRFPTCRRPGLRWATAIVDHAIPYPEGELLERARLQVVQGGNSSQDELARVYPAAWARIGARRAFMERALGVALAPEVLPFSSAPAYLPPFWLAPERVCVVAG